jgi:prolyl oligopeptidase
LKDFTPNGNSPTLLYGYGGFSSNIDPFFSIIYLLFAKHFNGVIAVPNIRGGGYAF